MIQPIIIAIVFIAALFYLGRMVFKSFLTKESCDTDCKCGTVANVKAQKKISA